MSDAQSSCSRGAIHGRILVVDVLVDHIRDPQTSYTLRDEILSLMKAGEIRHVVVDLQRVTFLGSVGLLAFLAVRRQLKDGSVALCNVAEGIQAMLELSMLVSTTPGETAPFLLESTVESALARLG